MKKFFKILIFSLFAINTFAQQATEIDSKSVKLPRYADLIAIQAAITSPQQGMMVYNIATASHWYYNGTAWTNTLGTVAAPLSLSQSAFAGITLTSIHTNSGPPEAFGGTGVRGESIGGEYGAGVLGLGQDGNYGVLGQSSFIGVYGQGGSIGGKFTGIQLALKTEGPLNFAGSGVGTISAGNVLTTDGSGNATWQSLSPLNLTRTTAGTIGDCTICGTRNANGEPGTNPTVDGGYGVKGVASGSQLEMGINGAGVRGEGIGYNYGVEGYTDYFVGVRGNANTGNAFVGTNNSNTKATAFLLNNNATGLALETSGGLKFGGTNVGTPATGKVLTATDASGNATWQAPQLLLPYYQTSNSYMTMFKMINSKDTPTYYQRAAAIYGEYNGHNNALPPNNGNGSGVVGVFNGTGINDSENSGVFGRGFNNASGVYGQADGAVSVGVKGYSDLGTGILGSTGDGRAGYFNVYSGGGGYALITGNGNVGIGTSTPTAKLEVSGFTKLGNDAETPKIKMKELTETTSSSNSGYSVGVAHGLDATKIISVSVIIETGGLYIPPAYDDNLQLKYNYFYNATTFSIKNQASSCASGTHICNKTAKVLITYKQ